MHAIRTENNISPNLLLIKHRDTSAAVFVDDVNEVDNHYGLDDDDEDEDEID